MSKQKSEIIVISSLDNSGKEDFKPISIFTWTLGTNVVNVAIIDANAYCLAYQLRRA